MSRSEKNGTDTIKFDEHKCFHPICYYKFQQDFLLFFGK